MNKDPQSIGLLIVFILAVAGTIYCGNAAAQESLQLEQTKDLEKQAILDSGLIIETADFHSPNMIIETQNITSIITQAKMLNQTTVFQTEEYGYVVMDKEGVYAWNYSNTLNIGMWFLAGLLFVASLFLGIFAFASLTYVPESHIPWCP